MIGIYARQSVDKADSISIESQIEFCRYELQGEEYKVYADRGYSGKNTARPAFADMMSDMENGIIGKVVVYKLDRISRSILDFANMMERFEKHKVEFVSTTEKFDTSSPMGRAMLNICIVFAQLERETIQKSVADAYFSRSQRSFYMGGRIPFGFRLVPTTIDGVKTAMYEAEPEQAQQVKLIYELYSHPECSYGDIIRHFQERQILKNGQPWTRSRIADILKNPIYVRADLSVYEFYHSRGAVMANEPGDFIGVNGCYCYKAKDAAARKQTNLEGSHLVLAPHEGIVSAGLWLKCRAKALEAQRIKPCQKAKNTWLAGKAKCVVCGYALVDKRAAAGAARYMLCSGKMNARACPGPGTIYTDELEEIVYRQMLRKLKQFTTLKKRGAQTDPELTAAGIELAQIEGEINSLVSRASDADSAMFRYISERVCRLDAKKRQTAERIAELSRRAEAGCAEINSHLTMWQELSFEDKRQTADQLIRVLYASSDSVKIEWHI